MTETMTMSADKMTQETEKVVPSYRQRLEKMCFEMFTKRGERACKTAVKKLFTKVEGKRKLDEKKMQDFFEKVMASVSVKHPEVWDTEPREHIKDLTNLALEMNGYNFEL